MTFYDGFPVPGGSVGGAASPIASIEPTKGRMLVGNGENWVPLPVGTNGYSIFADAAEATGVKWGAVAAGSPLKVVRADGAGDYLTAEAAIEAGEQNIRIEGTVTEAAGTTTVPANGGNPVGLKIELAPDCVWNIDYTMISYAYELRVLVLGPGKINRVYTQAGKHLIDTGASGETHVLMVGVRYRENNGFSGALTYLVEHDATSQTYIGCQFDCYQDRTTLGVTSDSALYVHGCLFNGINSGAGRPINGTSGPFTLVVTDTVFTGTWNSAYQLIESANATSNAMFANIRANSNLYLARGNATNIYCEGKLTVGYGLNIDGFVCEDLDYVSTGCVLHNGTVTGSTAQNVDQDSYAFYNVQWKVTGNLTISGDDLWFENCKFGNPFSPSSGRPYVSTTASGNVTLKGCYSDIEPYTFYGVRELTPVISFNAPELDTYLPYLEGAWRFSHRTMRNLVPHGKCGNWTVGGGNPNKVTFSDSDGVDDEGIELEDSDSYLLMRDIGIPRDPYSWFVVNFWFRAPTLPDQDRVLFSLSDGTDHLSIVVENAGNGLDLKRDAGTLINGFFSMSINTDYMVTLVKRPNTVGSSTGFLLYLNGSQLNSGADDGRDMKDYFAAFGYNTTADNHPGMIISAPTLWSFGDKDLALPALLYNSGTPRLIRGGYQR